MQRSKNSEKHENRTSPTPLPTSTSCWKLQTGGFQKISTQYKDNFLIIRAVKKNGMDLVI